jgi:hypothetical protein
MRKKRWTCLLLAAPVLDSTVAALCPDTFRTLLFPRPAGDEPCALRAWCLEHGETKTTSCPRPRCRRTTTVLRRKCHRPFRALFREAELAISMRKTGSLPRVRPVMAMAASFLIRATRSVAVVPRLSFRLGDQCVLYPRASLSAPPLSVQYLLNRPSLLPM